MAVELVREENKYATAFREGMQNLRADEPSWLRRLREKSFERFERIGFPGVENEEWKYTNVAPIVRRKFAPVLSRNGTTLANNDALASFTYEEARHSRLVFVNGILRNELSSLAGLPDGVLAMDLSAALRDGQYESTIRGPLEESANADQNGFAVLNTALFSGGLFLKIPRGLSVEAPIHLLFISDAQVGDATASFPRVLVVAEENSDARIIESYASRDDGVYLTNAIVDVVLGSGARLEHYKLQRESASAFHVAATRVDLGANAVYNTTTINFGAALSRHNIDVRMDHEGAECSVDGLYMMDGNQHTDTHSVIDHCQPRCRSHQLYKGILDGKSRAVFNGKVFVRHGAQQTDAQQTNKNLLLSKDARIDTKPQLEIFADDVKCTHGAAVGQLEDDEIFYLESRGIRPELARNLLTYGFAGEVIEKIKIDSIRRELDAAVLNRLHANLEIP